MYCKNSHRMKFENKPSSCSLCQKDKLGTYVCKKCQYYVCQPCKLNLFPDNICICQQGLKFSLTHPDKRQKMLCNQCFSKITPKCEKGYLYCINCDYDKCYVCIQKDLKSINYKELGVEVAKFAVQKGTKIAASTAINKAVQTALGGVVPGVGGAVMMHFNTIYAASQGDGKGVIKGATGGFGGMSGALIGTAICPGLGTLIGGIIGSGIGWLGGYGACKLVN